jgi:sialic acid synthase SpsE
MRTVAIGGRRVGPDDPLFVVIEVGTTCNGKLATALELVDAASAAGADAIKFQMIDPAAFMSDRTVTYTYEWAGGKRTENMFDMLSGLQFSAADWKRIRARCEERKILFYATVDFLPGIDLAEEVGVAAYKLGSWDTRHFPLVARMAKTGKPIQIDTGPTTLGDIDRLCEVIRANGNDQIVLVHCCHSEVDRDVNLRGIPFMRDTFDAVAGYSADTRDFVPDLVAVTLGARLVEKRLTLDRKFAGHHHVKALEPAELKDYIAMIRRVDPLCGALAVKPSAEDMRMRELYFVSVVAERPIPGGTRITADMLACKRPGSGISPEHLGVIVGRTARKDIGRDQLLSWDLI